MAHPVLPNDVMPVRPSVKSVVLVVAEDGFSYGTYSDLTGGRAAYDYACKNRATVLARIWVRGQDFAPNNPAYGDGWYAKETFTTLG